MAPTIGVRVSDVSGQRTVRATAVNVLASVGEFVQGVLAKMGLPQVDAAGFPLRFRAHLEREGRHLNPSELVGDALQDEDSVVLHPDIQAG
jgi:hypothetical protein